MSPGCSFNCSSSLTTPSEPCLLIVDCWRYSDGMKYSSGTILYLADSSLKFYSFNVALERHPKTVSLYRFIDSSYPDITPESKTELLHLRPVDLDPDNSLKDLPPLLRVGRGWIGDSSEIVLSTFCITADDCSSERYNVEWRSNVGSDNIVYTSSIVQEPGSLVGSNVFKVPAKRQGSSGEHTITLLATRFYNNGLGSSTLLKTNPSSTLSSGLTALGILLIMLFLKSLPASKGNSRHCLRAIL